MSNGNVLSSYEHVLTNGSLTTCVTRAGGGGVRFGTWALTRRVPDPTRDADGYLLFVRDLDDGVFWSVGHQPVQHPADRYAVRFGDGFAVFERLDAGIETRMELVLAPDDPADVRRLRLTNRSSRRRRVEFTSYAEAVLATPEADAAHPAFSKLFVQTEWDPTRETLLARRRLRRPDEEAVWLFHTLAPGTPGVLHGGYETDRARFVGRGRSLAAPRALDAGAEMSGTVGNVLDAVVSLQGRCDLEPGATATADFILGAADGRDEALRLAARYRNRAVLDRLLARVPAGALSEADAEATAVFFPARSAPSAYRPSPTPSAATRAADGAERLRFDNGYGGFSEDGRTYVIRVTPDGSPALRRPPMPWVNVVSNERHGFLVTESGAGYTWSVNSRENRLTPWYNDPVTDPHGEALYVRDDDAGMFWSPTPGPVPGAGAYEVRHGFGSTVFRHQSRDLDHELVQFVPRRDPVKVTRLRLTNRAAAPRRLSVFAYYRLALDGGSSEGREAIGTAYAEAAGLFLARRPGDDPFADRAAFATARVHGAEATRFHTADRASFLGPYGSLYAPAALSSAAPLNGRTGVDLDPCMAFQLSFVVPPGATVTCLLTLGQGRDDDEAQVLAARYRDEQAVAQALGDVTAFWERTLGTIQVDTPVPEIDLLVNGWLVYQTLSCRLWGRSAYYQAGGAFGYRDQLQDVAALVYLDPALTRAQILRHAAHQFVEGDVMHWWHPPRSNGLRTRFSDDLLWLPYVAAFYVQVTGDGTVLDEPVGFLSARALEPDEDEAYLTPSYAGTSASVYEHCCRALDRSLTRGAHGLPLMGSGDWNDGMNRVGRGGRGESVWLGFFLHVLLGVFTPLCVERGDEDRANRYAAYRADLGRALNDAGWDGAWYRRAFYDDGTPLGSAQSDECRIDAIAQAWAVLSGVAPPDRARQALDAVERHLVDRDAGLIRLLTPPFDRTSRDPGYIKGYVPGVRENGGQYTHGVLWAVRAMAEAGRADQAAALLAMLSPVSHTRTGDAADRYKIEPYVVAGDVYGAPPHVGRGGWSWYTGSSGWMYRVALESILGLGWEDGTTLRLRPVIPDAWPGFVLAYRVDDAGTTYRFDVTNPDGAAHRVVAARLDGRPLTLGDDAVRVPLVHDGQLHTVAVRLGA